MRISIMAPGNSSMDFHHIDIKDGWLIRPEKMDEDSFEAIIGIVAKAVARRNPTTGINPLDRIASVFEKMEEHRQEDSYAKEELAQLKAKLLVEEYLEVLAGIHNLLFTKAFLKSVDDLVRDMSYEYKQVKLGDALEALSKAMAGRTYEQVVHDKDAAAKAVRPDNVDSAPYIQAGFLVGDKVNVEGEPTVGTVTSVGDRIGVNWDLVSAYFEPSKVSHHYE